MSSGRKSLKKKGFGKVATRGYFIVVRVVGLTVLKNKLSEYVRFVRSGETVLVTDRDEVVAEIIPPRSGRASTIGDALLADAVRRGLVTPPLNASVTPPREPVAKFDEFEAELGDDRSER